MLLIYSEAINGFFILDKCFKINTFSYRGNEAPQQSFLPPLSYPGRREGVLGIVHASRFVIRIECVLGIVHAAIYIQQYLISNRL